MEFALRLSAAVSVCHLNFGLAPPLPTHVAFATEQDRDAVLKWSNITYASAKELPDVGNGDLCMRVPPGQSG